MRTQYLKHSPYENDFFTFNGYSYSIISGSEGLGVVHSLNRYFDWKPNLDKMEIELRGGNLITQSYLYNESFCFKIYKIEKKYTEKQFYEEIERLVVSMELER